MTSTERNNDGKRWDYSRPCYKENRDVFFEPGLFSIVVIAHGRFDLTRETVLGTLTNTDLFLGEIEWIFIENGGCDANYEFFQSLELERKVIVRQRNFGINEAINQGWALSRGEYVMILENDWKTNVSEDFLSIAEDIFNEQSQVGMIQLRDPRDPNENHGLGKPLYSPFTCDIKKCNTVGIVVSRQQTQKGHTYLLAGPYYAFNNNPILIRKSIYRQYGPYPEPIVGSDPRHGETLMQKEIYEGGVLAAYIGLPVYHHLGRVQTQAS